MRPPRTGASRDDAREERVLRLRCPTWAHFDQLYVGNVRRGWMFLPRQPNSPAPGPIGICVALPSGDEVLFAARVLGVDGADPALDRLKITFEERSEAEDREIEAKIRSARASTPSPEPRVMKASRAVPIDAASQALEDELRAFTSSDDVVTQPRPTPTGSEAYRRVAPTSSDVELKNVSARAANPPEARRASEHPSSRPPPVAVIRAPVAPVPLPIDSEALERLRADLMRLQAASNHDALGVVAGTRGEALRVAYLQQCRSFHPDRFAKYQSDDIQRLAHQAFVRIEAAYRMLSRPTPVHAGQQVSVGSPVRDSSVGRKTPAMPFSPPGGRTSQPADEPHATKSTVPLKSDRPPVASSSPLDAPRGVAAAPRHDRSTPVASRPFDPPRGDRQTPHAASGTERDRQPAARTATGTTAAKPVPAAGAPRAGSSPSSTSFDSRTVATERGRASVPTPAPATAPGPAHTSPFSPPRAPPPGTARTTGPQGAPASTRAGRAITGTGSHATGAGGAPGPDSRRGAAFTAASPPAPAPPPAPIEAASAPEPRRAATSNDASADVVSQVDQLWAHAQKLMEERRAEDAVATLEHLLELDPAHVYAPVALQALRSKPVEADGGSFSSRLFGRVFGPKK